MLHYIGTDYDSVLHITYAILSYSIIPNPFMDFQCADEYFQEKKGVTFEVFSL